MPREVPRRRASDRDQHAEPGLMFGLDWAREDESPASFDPQAPTPDRRERSLDWAGDDRRARRTGS